MKREEKTALTRQRVLDAALREFSEKGYDLASLNTLCAEKDISKGIIYHYFKDKDELYLVCVADCFDKLTAFLREGINDAAGTAEKSLQQYFDRRIRFFAANPIYLGVFLSAILNPPARLKHKLALARSAFDELNVQTLTELLKSVPLRREATVENVVEDFRLYMDYFNAQFQRTLSENTSADSALQEHEERCYRQIHILLYGVMEA